MSIEKTIAKLKQIAEKYDVEAEFTDEDKLNSYSRGYSIVLGKFEDEDEFIATFFHELAHSLTSGLLLRDLEREDEHIIPSTLASEGFAWVHAIQLAKENGFEWPIGHKVYQFMYECLFLYAFRYNDDVFRNRIEMETINEEFENYIERRKMEVKKHA